MERRIAWFLGTTIGLLLFSRHYAALAGMGFAMGLYQWLALRPNARPSFVALTGFAWLAGVGFAVVVDTPVSGAFAGLAVAYVQRRHIGPARIAFAAWTIGTAILFFAVSRGLTLWAVAPIFAGVTAKAVPPGRLQHRAVVAALLFGGFLWFLLGVIRPGDPAPAQTVRIDAKFATRPSRPGVGTPGWTLRQFEATTHAYLYSPVGEEARRLPMVVYLQGNGWQSVRAFAERRLLRTLGDRRVHLLAVEKIGVEPTADASRSPGPVFHRHDTRGWRTATTVAAIRAFKKHATSVHLLGFGEGGSVAAVVAVQARPQSVVIMASGGFPAWQEIPLNMRAWLHTGGGLVDKINARFIDAYSQDQIARILADPDPEKRFLGLAYTRWASYLYAAPYDDWREVNCPILCLHGVRDRASPIESARYLAELPNVSLREYPDLDHDFRTPRGQDRLAEILETALAALRID